MVSIGLSDKPFMIKAISDVELSSFEWASYSLLIILSYNLEVSLTPPPPNAPKSASLSIAQFTNKLVKPELCNTLEPPIQTWSSLKAI